jgi:hypothetical protein
MSTDEPVLQGGAGRQHSTKVSLQAGCINIVKLSVPQWLKTND